MKNSAKFTLITVIFLIAGIVMIIMGLMPPAELKDAETMVQSEITKEYSYYFQELNVLGEYASMTGDGDEGSYYIGYFLDSEGALCVTSIYFDNDKTQKQIALDFDFAEEIMLMEGCFKTRTVDSIDKDLERYYTDYAEEFIEELKDYTGSDEIYNTELHLRYVCEEKEAYADKAANTPALIAGIVFIALGALFLFLSTRMKKQEKARAEAAAAAAASYYGSNPFGTPGYAPNAAPTTPGTNAEAPKDTNYPGPEF